METEASVELPPLFRWTGGKRWLAPQIKKIIEPGYPRYFEPFLGGGAIFFSLRPDKALLSDRNEDLVECFRQIRDHPLEVSRALEGMPRNRESYYRIRNEVPALPHRRAARIIYLSTLAFNGIYRVNKSGQFNVPYGGRPYSGDPWQVERLSAYSVALKHAELTADDFEMAVTDTASGDLVYFDPPYTVTHSNNGFVKYNDKIFSWSDQKRLADVSQDLSHRGCQVIVTNAFHPSVRQLYPKFRAIEASRLSMMAADKSKRRRVQEYIFTNAW